MMIERISNFRMVRTVSEGEDHALLHAVSDNSGERVAVRLQRGDSATPEREQRWQRAVRVARLLAHPAVVRLIQAGRLADGSIYLIKEQLPGETLAARLSSRPRLAMNELLRLGRQVATVLVAAHARGIYHSALQPESLQLVPDPEAIGGERVKITDWGLARVPPGPEPKLPHDAAAPAPAESDPAQAAADEYPGPAPPVPLDAPTYLSPEQCRAGSAADSPAAARAPADLTDRVDVYALGVMLFQMAAGQLPFSGRAPSEIIAMHIAALPPKLEQRGITTPSGLGNLVATMLIKDPTARPTMREVEERLQQLAAQQQLAQTMTPATRASQQELALALPSTATTVQMRVPAEPPAGRGRRRALWALTVLLGVAALGGLWQARGMNLVPTPPVRQGAGEPALGSPVVAMGPPAKQGSADLSVRPPVVAVAPPPAAVVAPPAPLPTPAGVPAAPTRGAAAPNTPSPAAPALTAPVTTMPVRAAVVAPPPPSVRPPAPTSAPSRPGAAPRRDTRANNAKAPARPLPPAKKSPPGKPQRSPEAAAAAQEKLLAAQAALDRRDYAVAIQGATALLTEQPESAALVLGQAGCATGDLGLVNRAYASLRQHPAAVTTLAAECKKYSMELGVSGQFVRTKLR